MKIFDFKGFCDSCNTIMQRSSDEFYNEGIRRAMGAARHFIKPGQLERMVKTVIFNGNGHVSPDAAVWMVLNTLPREGIYDLLFGPPEEDQT